MDGITGEAATESGAAGFEWDADSQLYYHASTGFYHDPDAGWYYSSRDGQYYIYENGDYVLWTSDAAKEPKGQHTCVEANQAGLEPDIPSDENETWQPPSEWMEETLINMYLSGYSNVQANAENSLGHSRTNEEDKSEPTENRLSILASPDVRSSPNDATVQQTEDKMQTENFASVHESLGEEEENWLSQYGQVERVNDDLLSSPSTDLWDWDVVKEPNSKGQPMARLVGRLAKGSSKLHPSLPTRGGLLRTAPVREIHLDLVRVSSGKLYRLRNPSRKYLASLSAYDSSNPTKGWDFPDIYSNPDKNLDKQSTAHGQSEDAKEPCIRGDVSAVSVKEHKVNPYRDRAAERRILHGGLGIGPGQKQSNTISSDEYEERSEDMDSLGASSGDMNFLSTGLNSAKRIMEHMGWKEGEALGKSMKGIVEPIQPTTNKHGAGLGWKQTR